MVSRGKFLYFEDTLFSETFKVEENKVPSENLFSNYKCDFWALKQF